MYGGHWPQAGDRQAAALDRLIREADPTRASSTPRFRGIGTQGTGLAGVGYRVVGTAISGRETGGAARRQFVRGPRPPSPWPTSVTSAVATACFTPGPRATRRSPACSTRGR